MKTPFSSSLPVVSGRPRLLRATPLILAALLSGGAAAAQAPVSVSPTAPVAVGTPGITITPGAADLSAYTLARQPTASVSIAFPAGAVPTQRAGTTLAAPMAAATLPALGEAAAGVAAAAPPAVLQPHTPGGVFSEVNLGFLNGGTPPPPAAVTLQFDPARAGDMIWVQALDGGVVAAPDASGKPSAPSASGWVQLNPAGQAVFTFQAPALSARYQVLVRLDNVSTVLPFVVPDPEP